MYLFSGRKQASYQESEILMEHSSMHFGLFLSRNRVNPINRLFQFMILARKQETWCFLSELPSLLTTFFLNPNPLLSQLHNVTLVTKPFILSTRGSKIKTGHFGTVSNGAQPLNKKVAKPKKKKHSSVCLIPSGGVFNDVKFLNPSSDDHCCQFMPAGPQQI